MQLGLSTTTMICLFQARSSTHWMFRWPQKWKTHPLGNADKKRYLVNKQFFCTAAIRIGIVLIKTHFVALRTFDPPETPTGFWSRPVEVGTNIEVDALLVNGQRGLLAETRHWPRLCDECFATFVYCAVQKGHVAFVLGVQLETGRRDAQRARLG